MKVLGRFLTYGSFLNLTFNRCVDLSLYLTLTFIFYLKKMSSMASHIQMFFVYGKINQCIKNIKAMTYFREEQVGINVLVLPKKVIEVCKRGRIFEVCMSFLVNSSKLRGFYELYIDFKLLKLHASTKFFCNVFSRVLSWWINK